MEKTWKIIYPIERLKKFMEKIWRIIYFTECLKKFIKILWKKHGKYLF
jgi:hypothetical protein